MSRAAAHASKRMPDFAGVALVDILANGVAMLIIVIVVSIAARVERDQRYAEQADEVAAVMSHKFSTSLVLNSIAASPPAVLHDYDNSPIDQNLDLQVLPIFELHAGFVREFYSGAVWPRRELLREFNGMYEHLAAFSDEQKRRVRVDIYDVGQFYVSMSILREHGIRVAHWHFLTGNLTASGAGRCPPGVASKDCTGEGFGAVTPPQLALDSKGAGTASGGLDDAGWPAFDGDGSGGGDGQGQGQGQGGAGALPGGVVPGSGEVGGRFGDGNGIGLGSGDGRGGNGTGFGGAPGSSGGAGSVADLSSFPNAQVGGSAPSAGGQAGGQPGGQAGGQPGGQPGGTAGGRVDFRIALPEFMRRAGGGGNDAVPTLDVMFAAILHYLGELQDTLDAGGTPAREVADFAARIRAAFAAPPTLSPVERELARELAVEFALAGLVGDSATPPLAVQSETPPPPPLDAATPATAAADRDALLVLTPNQRTAAVAVRGSEAALGSAPPSHAGVALSLNAYPGIWKGLDLRLEPGSVLLMPPEPRHPQRLTWRAAAYISPRLDDFVIGFVFGDFDAAGRLRVQVDANRVRLGGRPLYSVYAESAFGTRGWLVSLYAALVGGLLLLLLARRWLSPGRARARARAVSR